MIVVFGSINIDIVVEVAALPQPGETVLSDAYTLVPGGKGANTALAAARAGAPTKLYGRIGDDDLADGALAMLRKGGVDLGGVRPSPRPTGCATIWVDAGGENAIVVASGANLDAAADQVDDADLGPGTIVALQMEVPARENWRLVERARGAGARILLNAAPAGTVPEDVLRSIDFVVVNENEASRLAANANLDTQQPTRVPRQLAERYGLTCIVTLGGAGALAFGSGQGYSVPALPVAPVDTTAAGDAFCGALATALARGGDVPSALRYAAVAGGLACTVRGAQTSLPDAAEVERRLVDLPEPRRLI